MYKNTDASPAQRAARHRVVVTRWRSRVDGGQDGRADESAHPVHVVEQRRSVHGLVGEGRLQTERAPSSAVRCVLENASILGVPAILGDLRQLQSDVEVLVAAPEPQLERVHRALGVVRAPGEQRRVERPAHDGLAAVAQAEDDERPPPARGLIDDRRCQRIRLRSLRRFGRRGLGDDNRRVFGVAAAVDDDEERGARAAAALIGADGGVEGERGGAHLSSPG